MSTLVFWLGLQVSMSAWTASTVVPQEGPSILEEAPAQDEPADAPMSLVPS